MNLAYFLHQCVSLIFGVATGLTLGAWLRGERDRVRKLH